MTRVAILSRRAIGQMPYAHWLADLDAELLLYAEDTPANRAADTAGYATVELFADWKRNRAVDLAVLDAHARAPLDRIVALSECDVVRAAELRERLGLPGQSVASARAFRDKPTMKAAAAAAGLAVPAFRVVDTVADLLDFVAEHGPAAVKPVDGAGARDVHRFADVAEAADWARTAGLPSDEPAGLLAESWIDAPILTVDGVLAAGQVLVAMVSRYTETCFASLYGQVPLGLLQLDPHAPGARAALEYTRALVAALPTPDEPTSFHAELFDAPDGPVLCEIASRTGGGQIDAMAAGALGLSLNQASVRGQAGLPWRRPEPGSDLWGHVHLPHRAGRVTRVPQHCPVPGVAGHVCRVAVGQHTGAAGKISEAAVELLLRAPDHEALRGVHAEALRWLSDDLRYG